MKIVSQWVVRGAEFISALMLAVHGGDATLILELLGQ